MKGKKGKGCGKESGCGAGAEGGEERVGMGERERERERERMRREWESVLDRVCGADLARPAPMSTRVLPLAMPQLWRMQSKIFCMPVCVMEP